MIYGLYLSAQGARAQSTRLDAVANNLANARTTAFKRALAVFQNHRPYDVENGLSGDVPGNLDQSTGGMTTADIVTDFAQGSLEATGGDLDVALSGPGFFQVQDEQGRQFLTRNGNFALNRNGELVQADTGYRVLNADGVPLEISGSPASVRIAPDGTISQETGGDVAVVGRLGVFAPQSLSQLKAVGNSLYESPQRPEAASPATQVRQGYREASGVNPVQEMMEMIQASRSFETNVNMIRYQDESLGRLLQSLPRR